jgi:hypothetical protein
MIPSSADADLPSPIEGNTFRNPLNQPMLWILQHRCPAENFRASGLAKPSRAVANQIRTIAGHRIVKRLGRLSTAERDAVDRAIAIQLGLNV